jgi:hypothetical protein
LRPKIKSKVNFKLNNNKYKNMRSISDKDLGIEDSDFVAEGDTDDEVIEIMRDHIQNEFPDQYDRVRGMIAMYIKDSEKNTQEGRDNTDGNLDDL